jgi:hypothetical protein
VAVVEEEHRLSVLLVQLALVVPVVLVLMSAHLSAVRPYIRAVAVEVLESLVQVVQVVQALVGLEHLHMQQVELLVRILVLEAEAVQQVEMVGRASSM